MTNEQLFDLLKFEPDLAKVEICRQEENQDLGAEFIVAELTYTDGITMLVPFVYYAGNDWIFTPRDWQGALPTSMDQAATIDWRVNGTDTEGIILNGLPMLPSWELDPEDVRREFRRFLGATIHDARRAKGITGQQIEDMTGIHKNQLTRIECGRMNTGIDTIAILASVLDLEITIRQK